jgi:hypothetical protein
MKNFYEMIKILENEQIKTPADILTPEELEEYENEKSPMYRSLFLKDIDAKRKAKEPKPEVKNIQEPETTKEPEEDNATNDTNDLNNGYSIGGYLYNICNVIYDVQNKKYKNIYELSAIMKQNITSYSYSGHIDKFKSTNQQIIDVLDNSQDIDSAVQGIKKILEKLGLKIEQKAGDRSKFNEEIHEIYLTSCKEGEDIVLKSDLLMFGDEVLFKASALPINEYTLKMHNDLIDNPLKNLQPVHFK